MIRATTISKSNNALKTILLTGFTAGTLDGIGAAVVHQIHPIQLFQYVASGAIGREAAFSGGIATALLGLLFHYIIAFSWTILFFYLYPKVSLLRRNKYVVGVLYALFVWIIMNMVVVPSTLIGRGPFFLKHALIGWAILVMMIGLPISIMVSRYYKSRKI
jgi:hypothetical protein